MSRNGSGTYTLPAGNPVVTGTTISSTWANSTLTNIASALTDSLAADGQTTATGNLKMGNNRITGLADGIAATDAASLAQVTSAVAITGGTINGTTIGATTPATGKFTTLEATGVTTVQAGTVSAPAITTTGDTNTGIFFPAADTISFSEGGAEAMRITSAGDVGIGTTAPATKLQVAGTTRIGVTGTNGVLQLARTSDGATISSFKTDGTSGIIDSVLSTTFQINTAEAMRIDTSGNFLFNTTQTSATNTQGMFVKAGADTYASIGHASGVGSGNAYALFLYDGTAIGTITQNGTTGVLYNITSDYRLKTVIAPVTNAGQRIDALQPIEYDWKVNGGRTRGFLAHQFAEVYPNSVSGEKDAIDKEGKPKYQSMQAATSEVMADLIAEIQSLRKRVAQLESK